MQLSRPEFISVPLAIGRKWRGGGGWVYQEKKDGCWCELELCGSVIVGERMRDGSFWPFDVPILDGADIRREPLRLRLERLADLLRQFSERLAMIPQGSGGEFLEAVLSRGGEGIVAKHLESRYGEVGAWVKCKRSETHDCTVLELHHSKQSVRLGQWQAGQLIDCGWVPVLSESRLAGLVPGSVVEIACHSRHASGKFREARLLRSRQDKTPAACHP